MKQLGPFYQATAAVLSSIGISRQDITDLFLHIYGVDRLTILTEPTREIDENLVLDGIHRLKTGEPLSYIIGSLPFFGCNIKVNRSVLIPRQETELLVAFVLEETKKKSGLVVDLCTGSGCIGIAIKKARPDFMVVLVDNSENALALAQENAILNEVELTCLKGDFLDPLRGQKIDLLICNPPYVSNEEYEHLDKSVKDYEPKEALVAENNGLFFYEKLAEQLPSLMDSGAEVFLEIGSKQGISVPLLFGEPHWTETRCHLDLASHPRFVSAKKA